MGAVLYIAQINSCITIKETVILVIFWWSFFPVLMIYIYSDHCSTAYHRIALYQNTKRVSDSVILATNSDTVIRTLRVQAVKVLEI